MSVRKGTALYMNTDQVMVSLVIPVYNALPYLRRCLNGCLSQNYEFYEIICIDDGSTDGSDAVLDAFKIEYPDRFRVFHTVNQGVSEARNLGTREAKGKYIWYIDPDDEIAENILRDIADMIHGVDLLLLPYVILTEENNDLELKREFWNGKRGTDFKVFVTNNAFDKVWNYIVSKDIIIKSKLSFGKNIVLAEDRAFDFFLKEHIDTWDVYDKIAYYYIIKNASASKGHVHNDEFKKRMIENAYWTAIYIEESISRYDNSEFINTAKKYQYENVREVISTGIRLGDVKYLNEKISVLKKNFLYPVSLKKLIEYNTSFFQGIKGAILNCNYLAVILCTIRGIIRR